MSTNENTTYLDIGSNTTNKESGAAAVTNSFKEVSASWGLPYISNEIINPRNLSQNLSGAGEGFLQACKECFDPTAIKEGLIQTAEMVKNAGQYVAKRITSGNATDLMHDLQIAGEGIKQAGKSYLQLSAKEQGHIIGHDLLPLIAPDGFGIIKDAKLLRRASEVLATASELPSGAYLRKLDSIFDRLHPMEKELIDRHDVKTIGLKNNLDIKHPRIKDDTLCFYDRTNKKIYIAEEVKHNDKWIKHPNLEFNLKHQVGHAVNYHTDPSGEWLSERQSFQKAYQKDANKLSDAVFNGLKLSVEDPKQSRDYVFAELYAHATGGITTESRAHKIKACFPRCYEYVRNFNYAK